MDEETRQAFDRSRRETQAGFEQVRQDTQAAFEQARQETQAAFEQARQETRQEIRQAFDHLAKLIEEVSTSLDRDMKKGFAELSARFDVQHTRLERHAGMLQTGSRWVNRINQWSERYDRLMADRESEIRDLRKRIERLENRLGPDAA